LQTFPKFPKFPGEEETVLLVVIKGSPLELAETLNPAPAVRAVFCVAVNQRRAPLREDKRRDDRSAAWRSKSFCFFHSRSHGGQQRRARQVTTFTHQSFLLHLLPWLSRSPCRFVSGSYFGFLLRICVCLPFETYMPYISCLFFKCVVSVFGILRNLKQVRSSK